MSGDAVAVFHPTSFEALRPFLDLDDENEESDGLYAELLDDGSVLVHTFLPYEAFADDPAEVFGWLEQFGDVLPEIHDDVRGLLFFPDTYEPTATTYDGVVAEMADKGFFVPLNLDLEPLKAAAATLMGGEASSFAIGKLFEDVQKQLASAFGVPEAGAEGEDEEPSSDRGDDRS